MQQTRLRGPARRGLATIVLGILATVALGSPAAWADGATDESTAGAYSEPAAEPKGTEAHEPAPQTEPAPAEKTSEEEILAASQGDPRIVGGTVAPANTYPFYASLQTTGGSPFCGASLISSTRVLTAAHCVDGGTTPGSIRIVAGRDTLSNTSVGFVSNITAIAIHPSFNSSSLVNDVAILSLATPLPVNDPALYRWVRVAVPGDPYAPGNVLRLVGHGRTCSSCSGTDALMQVDLPVQSDATSQSIWGSSFDPATMIGAGPTSGSQGGCFGDSGGPLFVNGALQPAQVGDVSWGSSGCNSTTNFGELPNLVGFINGQVPRPGNDNFPGSTISGALGDVGGSTTDATGQRLEPVHAGSAPDTSVWYSWTAPESGPVNMSVVNAAFDTTLAVYTGSSVSALTAIASNDDSNGTAQSKLTFNATSGTTYRIAVDGFSARWGTFNLQWAVNPQANDNFASPTALSGPTGRITSSNARSTGEPGEPSGGSFVDRTVWFRWTAPESGTATLNTRESTFDTVLAVYTGSAINALTVRAANDDSGGTAQSKVNFPAIAGTVYQIQVDGFAGATGAISLQWSVNMPANDDFANARVLPGDSGNTNATTIRATGEPGSPEFHGGAFSDNSVWFTWTPVASAPAIIRLHNVSGLAPGVEVYTGTAINALTSISSGATSAAFNAVAGTPYRIAVDGNGGSVGTFLLEWVLGRCDGLNATMMGTGVISGTSGNDVIVGSTLVDTITAGAGDDRICGLASNDSLSGEGGNDRIFGGLGGDTLSGGGGNDFEFGELGDDRFNEGSSPNGADRLDGGDGKDRAHYNQRSTNLNVTLDGAANDGAAGEGDNVLTERIFGGSGNDSLTGDALTNQIDGGGGNDTISGGGGKDALIGGSGADDVFGDGGDDALTVADGVNGNDFADGGTGNDTATSDPGDTVVNVP